jgi:hypothetical protein
MSALSGVLPAARAGSKIEECDDLLEMFRELEANTRVPPSVVTFGKIDPASWFPPEYAQKLASQYGPLHIELETGAAHDTNQFYLRGVDPNLPPIVEFRVYSDWFDHELLHIEALVIRDPTHARPDRNLWTSQQSKGLPFPVFLHVIEKIKATAREIGFRRIKTAGAQTYAVSVLYRRYLKMIPADAAAEETYANLDRLYRYAKSALPEGYRAKSMDEFSTMLDIAEIPLMDMLQKIGRLSDQGWTPIIGAEGRPMGYLNEHAGWAEAHSRVKFVDPVTGSLYHFGRLAAEGRSDLILELYPDDDH